MAPRIGVVVFPGTNCEHDVVQAVERLGGHGELLWHGDTALGAVDAVVLPGGFAHGDYLRPGALARFPPSWTRSPASPAGGAVVGICNGFQVLTEAGLLPGALQKNGRLRFLCEPTRLRVTSTASVLTGLAELGEELVIPINHFSGSYTCDARRCAPCATATGSCCATRTTRTARWTTSPASPTRPATWSG